MEKKVFYLYPEVEGKQHYVCWGISKEKLGNSGKTINSLILEGLRDIKGNRNRWISQRSFSVFLGEDLKHFWVAVPRQLSAKAIKTLGDKLNGFEPQIVITSYRNPFGEKFPFRPVISYDRGFIFDSTAIEEKLLNQKENVVNN